MSDDKSMEQEILINAEELFLEKGFALTSTTQIAKKTGCNQALVHYYFRTKEKLFQEIFFKKALTFINSFLKIEEGDFTFEEKIEKMTRSHFAVLLKNQRIPFLFINELMTNPGRLASIKEKLSDNPQVVYEKFAADLDSEIADGRVRMITPLNLIVTILSLNLTPFLIKPVLSEILEMNKESYNNYLTNRLDENVTNILESIRVK